MKYIKIVKSIGLLLFLIGFSVFLGSFFLGSYRLDQKAASLQIGKEKLSSLQSSSPGLYSSSFNNSLDFVYFLDQSFTKTNESVLQTFSFTESNIDAMLGVYDEKENLVFDLEKSLNIALENDQNREYKYQKFQDYASWMNQKTYPNISSLKDELIRVSKNIEKFAIVKEKGFDKYEIKSLKFSLTKRSHQSSIKTNSQLFMFLTYGFCLLGAALYILPRIKDSEGIKNNGIFQKSMTNVGWLGVFTGAFLILFYIVLYYYPEYMVSWIIMVDPISVLLKGTEAGRFFLYGFIYTICILVMGVRMILKYRHSKYQIIRTFSVMFFQTSFAFLIPELLLRLNQPYFDFKNIWPLDYDFFFNNEINTLIQNGNLGLFMLVWGIGLVLIGVPVFVYFFGKRWYCSWVCGCGGLAETLGDPYRQLSDKSLKAWRFERWSIHGVLVFAIVMTIAVLYTYFTGESELLGINSYKIRETYGAWIGAGFAGVIGTGFYPLMGNRVWCRFGCPLAAYLGIVQKFKSRFRITTNGGQCISCGNCSTYCEMGIDVRWYAQRGQNIIRSSCVGCGVCSSVCPRGVLNLEVKDEKGRYNEPILIGMDKIEVKLNGASQT